MDEFSSRRSKLAAQMQNNSIALLPRVKLQMRNATTAYPFRQNSDFYYLTGFTEPDSMMALCKDSKNNISFILFNRANDPHEEIWNGKRVGQDGACKIYNADEAYDIVNIDDVMPKLFADKQIIYYPLAAEKDFDQKIVAWLAEAKHQMHNKEHREWQAISFVPDTLIDLMPLIHELRLLKSELEITAMRKAAEISALAHEKLMKICRAGLMEYQLEATFNEYCLQNGCRGFAYPAIVAGGNNACTLHYTANDQVLKDGDLVLVDAGGEFNYYASDITRTFPVNGKFSTEQRQIYELVLKAQLAGIEQVKPGNTFDSIQQAIVEVIVKGLLKLGILSGVEEQLMQDKEYKKYYMHSSGHWLGLDVHDPGTYKQNNQWRKLEPGMVLTVEPGIYIANTIIGVDAKWLGIGVRIEDDVLVTKKGHEVLSHKAPKTIDEIERARI